jgi:hypothetical protein
MLKFPGKLASSPPPQALNIAAAVSAATTILSRSLLPAMALFAGDAFSHFFQTDEHKKAFRC